MSPRQSFRVYTIMTKQWCFSYLSAKLIAMGKETGSYLTRVTYPKMRDARAAFVILTWNSAQYISQCLSSVLQLPFQELIVYVVDNGSQDGTIGVLRDFSQKHHELRIVELDENKGTTVSRNIVLAELVDNAEVDYVCVLDSDTIVNSEAFEELCEVYVRDTRNTIGVLGPRMHNADSEYQLSGRNLPTVCIKLLKAFPLAVCKKKGANMEIPSSPLVNGLQDVGYLLSACWFMPQGVLRRVGLLDEKIFYAPEDVDYCVRVHQSGLRVVFCAKADIVHFYQRISHKKIISRTNVKHIVGLAYFFSKYRYLFRAPKFNKNFD